MYVDNGVELKIFPSDLKGRFYAIISLRPKGGYYAMLAVLYITGTFYAKYFGAYLHMLTDLRCWGRTHVVMLANFHYNSIMMLSVYISAKRTIIGYIKPLSPHVVSLSTPFFWLCAT